MEEKQIPEAKSLQDLPPPVLEEVIRQFRSARNDILRYGVWNLKNLEDDEFNKIEDEKLFDYFRQDLLETKFVDRGRRVELLIVWQWFDDQLCGRIPLLVGGREHILNVQDKDVEKIRRRCEELESLMPVLREGDFEGFRRIKYKLRRTVLRLTYDLHHLNKRLDKYRKRVGGETPRGENVQDEAAS